MTSRRTILDMEAMSDVGFQFRDDSTLRTGTPHQHDSTPRKRRSSALLYYIVMAGGRSRRGGRRYEKLGTCLHPNSSSWKRRITYPYR
jgi:hypothetical protein